MGALLCSILIRPSPFVRTRCPQPLERHRVLDSSFIGERRVFVIGDVHGCLDELQELLIKANINGSNDICVFVGDMINKGPKNIETLHFVKQMNNCFCVRGNHENAKLCDYLQWNSSWGSEDAGSENQTLKKVPEWIHDLSDDDVSYLTELPYTISLPSLDALVVHAGLVPGLDLEKQRDEDMVSMRNLILDNGSYHGSRSTDEGKAWASVWQGPPHVYFGHDAMRKLQRHTFATGLDTGCVYGGSLTGIFLTGSKEMHSVKAHGVHQQPSITF